MNSGDSLSDDRYESIEGGDEIELRVQGSRFLAQVYRVVDEATARERLDELRRRYHDATHHCSAWRLGCPDEVSERSDDDGEPSQSAGRPILAALRGAKLFDALIVVTRYFGGTKLGTGGLSRAYGAAAAAAIESSTRVELIHRLRLLLDCSFDDVGRVEAILGRHAECLLGVARNFAEAPHYQIDVLRSHNERLLSALVEGTAGRVRIQDSVPVDPLQRQP